MKKVFFIVLSCFALIYMGSSYAITSCGGTGDSYKCAKVQQCREIFIESITKNSTFANIGCEPDTGTTYWNDRCPPGHKCHCTVRAASSKKRYFC